MPVWGRYLWPILLAVSLALGGCATKPPPEGVYAVKKGDTLYSIAFSHGLDYRAVARWNGIRPPYVIYPKQHIKVRPPKHTEAVPAVTAKSKPIPRPAKTITRRVVIVKRGDTLYSLAKRLGVDRSQLAQANNLKYPYTIHVGDKLALPDTSTAQTTKAPALSVPVTPTHSPDEGLRSDAVLAKSSAWVWPVKGPIARKYQSWGQGKKGIGIAGQPGDPVRAASAGRVVYSGGGLIGYGELIIIKHSSSYLSAYGHNRKRLVREGDRVAQGQTIAELGQSGSNSPMLHFEIRHRGTPVNPLTLLPR